MKNKREKLSIFFNILIIIFVGCGAVISMNTATPGTGLSVKGIANLKFFTVLSNLFSGVVAVLWVIFCFLGKKFPILIKMIAVASVGLTFFIIAAFLQPMNPQFNLYEGGNFWFHLVAPVVSMLDFIFLETDEKIPFKYTFIAAAASLVYGIGYLINLLVNGIGEWPDTNDWYGFVTWGYPVGFGIFAFIVLLNFGIAVLFRALNIGVNKKLKKSP